MSEIRYIITRDGIYPAALIIVTKETAQRYYGYEAPESKDEQRRSWRYSHLQGRRPNQYAEKTNILIGPDAATPALFRALMAATPALEEERDAMRSQQRSEERALCERHATEADALRERHEAALAQIVEEARP